MIITAPNSSYCLSSMAALRESQSLKATFTKTHAERVLDTFVARGWLYKSKSVLQRFKLLRAHTSTLIYRKGRYSLTTRSTVELQTYITNTFPNDVLHCTVCHEMVFRGVRCYTRNCEGLLHSHCHAAYKRARQTCPVCDTPWNNGDSEGKLKKIGEGAFVEGQDKHARTRRRTDDDEDEDEDEVVYYEGEDGEDAGASGSTQPSQTRKKGKGKATAKGKASAKAKGKGKAREESMDVDVEEEELAPKRKETGRNKITEDENEDEEDEVRPKRKSRR